MERGLMWPWIVLIGEIFAFTLGVFALAVWNGKDKSRL